MLSLRQVNPDDWRTWRCLRLRALSESPEAFHSRYDEWQAAPEERWRARLSTAAYNYIVEIDGEPVGMGSGFMPPRDSIVAPASDTVKADEASKDERAEGRGTMEIMSLWVAPEARGQGAGQALLAGIEKKAMEVGAGGVVLSAMAGNEAAAGLYERAGYARVRVWKDEGGLDMVEFARVPGGAE